MKHIILHIKNREHGQVRLPNVVLRGYLSHQSQVFACLSAILVFFTISTQAQGPAREWDKAITGMVDGQSEVVKASGGDLIIGKKTGNFSYQLLRVNTQGIIELNKTYNGIDYTATSTILSTADHGYLLGSIVNNESGKYYQMIKLTNTGEQLWKKKYGVPFGVANYQPVIQTGDGGFIMGGYTDIGIGGDKTEALKDLVCSANPSDCLSNTDYWILKVDQNGNKLWDKSFGGSAEDNLRAMVPTPDGGCLLAGNSFSPTSSNSTNKTSVNLGVSDFWLVKVSSNGSKQWEKSLGGNNEETPKVMVQTSDGGFLLTGDSDSGTNPEKTVGTDGVQHPWLVKVDKEGSYQWDLLPTWKISLSEPEIITPTKDDGFLIGVSSQAGSGGIKTEGSQGGDDYWIIKYTSDGKKQWDKRFGGSGQDKLLTLNQVRDGGFELFGYSQSGPNGDKTVLSIGGWLVKTYPAAPTNLTATPVSATQIDLSWKDNLVNESYYLVERTTVISGSSSGVFTAVATLSGNATSYSDKELPTNATYAYRIKAIRVKPSIIPTGLRLSPIGSSDYSKTAMANLINASVRILDFSPKSGPAGTEVIIKGYGFIHEGAYYVSNVKINTTPAAPYGVENERMIRAKVAVGTTSGLISLLTPGGATIVSETSFTVILSLYPGIEVARINGEEEGTNAETVRFFPNPVHNTLNLALPGAEGEELVVSVYDLTGKLWGTFNTVAARQVHQFDVSGLASGMYLLSIQSSSRNQSFRLIKK